MKSLVAFVCIVLLCGCAGGRCRVTARSVPQPVSCTPCVFEASGKIRSIHDTKSQEIVRHIEFSKCNWTMLWTSIPLNREEWDISNELNAQLQQTPGNAVVNVTIRAEGCNLVHWFVATVVGVIPSYVNVKVAGDIVNIADVAPEKISPGRSMNKPGDK